MTTCARLALLVATFLTFAAASFAGLPNVRDGDVIFHTSRSAQSLAVQTATQSKYSHMGMIMHRDGKPFVLEAVATVAQSCVGRPYDLTFEWSDERIYCSELVWKAYDRALGIRIGSLDKVRSFNLSHPAVRVKMRERYANRVPLDEPVISPAAMFASPLLVTIAAN